ncbi:MAG: PhzF family phenazine biosynthesis protein [Oscillospiraceae bacterium]|jgi:PhzF family phenazine biosynthesis protein|nr:PhzF family phenazine biosynthesis protein [Oscillospiraceae bacterium]
MKVFDYAQMDVFTANALEGNGLAVVFCDAFPPEAQMLALAREFKQFETIFLQPPQDGRLKARIFTMEGELPFAGHPLLGGISAAHARYAPDAPRGAYVADLPGQSVAVWCEKAPHGFTARMRQGRASFLGTIPAAEVPYFLAAHGLTEADLDPTLPVAVVSTGLPYLLLPVRGCLPRARIVVTDLAERLAAHGAAYAYLFDADTLEARTWDNLGLVEDAATGSAAGPLCAYLVREGRAAVGERLRIAQGACAFRPSFLTAWVDGAGEVYVQGDVVPFAKGQFMLDE